MGCTGSKQTKADVVAPPELPTVDPVKAKENAKPVGGTVFAFGESPDLSNEKQKKFLIFYLVRVKLVDPESAMSFQIVVYRRFSQFELFREKLLKSRKYERIPALPKKKMFGKTNRSNDNLTQRRKELSAWLDEVAQLPHILEDELYLDFLTQEADEAPVDIKVQATSDPIVLQGEDADMSESGGSSDVDEPPIIRAVSGTVYALGRSPDDHHPGKNLVFFVIRVKLEDYDNGLTSHSIVYRRFSQFEQFRERLVRSRLYENVPLLPKKKLIGQTNKSDDHLFTRQTDLESWLRLVGQLPHVIEDPNYQMFLTEEAGDEPGGFRFCFHDPNIVGRLSDDDSSDEDSEEAFFGDDDSVEVIVRVNKSTEIMSPEPLESTSGMSGASAALTEAISVSADTLPPPPTTYAYQTISGYGSGIDATKPAKQSTCIYYALRVNSTTQGIKGVHEMVVYRRFSQFEKLRRELVSSKVYNSVPPLPKKKIFGNTSTNTGHMMNRKNELTAWMRTITDTLPNIAGNPAYMHFVSDNGDEVPDKYCPHGTFVMF